MKRPARTKQLTRPAFPPAATINELAREHKIKDVDGLTAVVRTAYSRRWRAHFGSHPDHPPRDSLPRIAKLLREALAEFEENGLGNELSLDAARDNPEHFREALLDLVARAERAHRPGKPGRRRNTRLRSAVRLLVDYWRGLGRKVSRDFHTELIESWVGPRRRKRLQLQRGPATEFGKFCADCITLIAPEEQRGLEWALANVIRERTVGK
jgi:hypothetical protein